MGDALLSAAKDLSDLSGVGQAQIVDASRHGSSVTPAPKLAGKGRAVPFVRPSLPSALRPSIAAASGTIDDQVANAAGTVTAAVTDAPGTDEIGSGVRHEGVDWKMMLRLGTNWQVDRPARYAYKYLGEAIDRYNQLITTS